jgi:pimeloyl-ACP methyl ester carboxylesterase
MKFFSQLVAFAAVLTTSLVSADTGYNSCDLNGSNFTYPYPVHLYNFKSQGKWMQMAYMDVAPTTAANGETIMLMHGKNFCGATWNATAIVLADAGYRVIIPDQIGFCKSTKPEAYQFSLQQLALNTNGLLRSLGIDKLNVMGHSLGGMLATRFALMYPTNTTQLILTNPIGLEDWKALGVPYLSIDEIYKQERSSTYASIRGYEQATYYVGQWKPEYDVWVYMLLNIYQGSEGADFAYVGALITDAVYTQPIVYEFPLLKMPTLLLIGGKDNTAIGKQWAPPSVVPLLGHYDVLGQQIASVIPNATLIPFPDLGHAPQISAPDRFHTALLGWLKR